MALTSANVIAVEQTPNNGCLQNLHPQGKPQLPPASPWDSPRSAGESDQDSIWTTASALGLGVCAILCLPSKSRVSVSYSPTALLNTSPTGFQSQVFWGLILVQDFCTEKPDVGLGPLTPWGTSLWWWYSSHLWVANLELLVLTIPHLHPFYLSCGFFFMSLVVENLSG